MTVKIITNNKQLKETLKGPSFIFYHWKDCGHCKVAEPKFNEASKLVGGVNFASLEVEDMQNTEFKNRYNSFPKFEGYNSKGKEIKYDGGREVNDFVEFANQLSDNIKGGNKKIPCGMYESEHGCPGHCKKPKKGTRCVPKKYKSTKRKSTKRKSTKRKSTKNKSRKSIKRKSTKRKSANKICGNMSSRLKKIKTRKCCNSHNGRWRTGPPDSRKFCIRDYRTKKKSTKRKSTKKKSTKRKSTKRKSTKRKSSKRK